MKSNPRIWWKVFVVVYLQNGQNASAAYRVARPGVTIRTSEVSASKLLRKTEFLNYLEHERMNMESKLDMDRDEWIRLLADAARFDIRQYLKIESGSGKVQLVEDWQKRADGHVFETVELTTTTLDSGAVVQRVRLKRKSKLKALEILGKALGYFEEKIDLTNQTTSTPILILTETDS